MSRFSSFNRAETLRIFFGIPQARIDRDLGGALLDVKRICEEIDAYCALAEQERTPELSARRYHNQFLQAHCMRKLPAICEAEALFHVASAAEDIVNDAAMNALEKGQIGELMRQMEEIERREGLKEREYWSIGEGPPDYQAANAQSDVLLEKIDEAVMPCVLRRYRFGAVADLYERNRMEFDVMREVGRRQVFPEKCEKLNDGESKAKFFLELLKIARRTMEPPPTNHRTAERHEGLVDVVAFVKARP
jgi:hypothetical protein